VLAWPSTSAKDSGISSPSSILCKYFALSKTRARWRISLMSSPPETAIFYSVRCLAIKWSLSFSGWAPLFEDCTWLSSSSVLMLESKEIVQNLSYLL
jgi:hypothetical protein